MSSELIESKKEKYLQDGMGEIMNYIQSYFSTKKRRFSWTQTMCGRGTRSRLNQQFNLRVLDSEVAVGYRVGASDMYNTDILLIGIGKDKDNVFQLELTDNEAIFKKNVAIAVKDAKKFVDEWFI